MADVQLRYIPNSEVTIHIVNLCKRPPGWKSATRGRKRSGRKKATLAEPKGAEDLLLHHDEREELARKEKLARKLSNQTYAGSSAREALLKEAADEGPAPEQMDIDVAEQLADEDEAAERRRQRDGDDVSGANGRTPRKRRRAAAAGAAAAIAAAIDENDVGPVPAPSLKNASLRRLVAEGDAGGETATGASLFAFGRSGRNLRRFIEKMDQAKTAEAAGTPKSRAKAKGKGKRGKGKGKSKLLAPAVSMHGAEEVHDPLGNESDVEDESDESSRTATTATSAATGATSAPSLATSAAVAERLQRMAADDADDETGAWEHGEEYFTSRKTVARTSDRTLADLELNDARDVAKLVRDVPLPERQLAQLQAGLDSEFPRWNSYLRTGFSLLLYGFGSKKALLQRFARTYMTDGPVIILNGYHPSASVREVVGAVARLVGVGHPAGTAVDQVKAIVADLEATDAIERLYLLVHNIDGSELRTDRIQTALSLLAACGKVHLAASIDHIKAPLLWDQPRASRFRWAYVDATTMAHYDLETAYDPPLMAKADAGNVQRVFVVTKVLTANARKVLLILIDHQLNDPASRGLGFQRFYTICQDDLVVTNQSRMRAILTEFTDHEIIVLQKDATGSECYYVPFDADTLKQIKSKLTGGDED